MSSSDDGTMEISSTQFGEGARDPAKNVKRSCNNCRQQKLKCDVVQSPFTACSRCRRLQKECRVEGGFKRVGKRDKYAAMQREIEDLRRQLQVATRSNLSGRPEVVETVSKEVPQSVNNTKPRKLGDVKLSEKTVDNLFKEYFTHYHHYLPFLDPESSPNQYFEWSCLLGWTIIIVAARRSRQEPQLLENLSPHYTKLLWSTISECPQPYHAVKALCLICTWPLPSTSNPSDVTCSLSSLMMSLAMQNVLDFPVHLQFSRGKVTEGEQRDRRLSWCACNIVAQSTSSAYGFPSQANFDRLVGSSVTMLEPYSIPKDIMDQLLLTQLYHSIGKTLYENVSDPSGFPLEHEREATYSRVRVMYEDTVNTIGTEITMNTEIMLLAANVQVNTFAFFLPTTLSTHQTALTNLYDAACTFIRKVMDFETETGAILEHCTNIILQSIFSAAMALLKLLHSSFAASINVEHGKALFNAALLATRRMSLRSDDVCARMAVRVPQLVKDLAPGGHWASVDPLDLKIRARMCVNHQYDCMWHWLTARRHEAQTRDAASKLVALQEGDQAAQSGADMGQSANIPDLTVGTTLIGDGVDYFNSMDWLLSDFCPPFEFPTQDGLI